MDRQQAVNVRQRRAAIMDLLYANHRKREPKMRFTPLHGALQSLFFEVSENDLLSDLEDMKEREYLVFDVDEALRKKTGEKRVGNIALTFKGRNVVEGQKPDDYGVDFA